MPTRTEAIKNVLNAFANPDLASWYNHDMECQVNVAQDGGFKVDGEYKGRRWTGWSDGVTEWKSFRIPRNAATEPEYTDFEIKFDLAEHAEGIGMTGWNWKNKTSVRFGFDFDAVVGHSEKHARKMNDADLKTLIEIVKSIDWVTCRKSTSGKGIHMYVELLDPVPTENHTEHAALARAILSKLSALCGFDFKSKVDTCGGNMWIWHRKNRGTDGFALIKQGVPLTEVPANWRDHLIVIANKKKRITPAFVTEQTLDPFEELCGQGTRIPLDTEHKKLIEYLQSKGDSVWWWDSDHHMLVTHTIYLKEAHTDLALKGVFDTIAKGSERGSDHNCFAFPMRRGAWGIRRYSPGCMEHASWTQDQAGWTRCYLNKEPDLQTAARTYGGIELPTGGFQFREAEMAVKAALHLGADVSVPPELNSRETVIKQHKDGRLIIEIQHTPHDPPAKMTEWALQTGKWKKLYNTTFGSHNEVETGNFDDVIRHLISPANKNAGWCILSNNIWQDEPLEHLKPYLKSLGYKNSEIEPMVGACVTKAWKLVNKPFQHEYPGNREWNKDAAQFKYVPSTHEDLKYPTWMKILSHCGKGLDDAIKGNVWATSNGIMTGADYLKCWIASLFQFPFDPLPYLFLFGPQDCGKSILHEAIELLLTSGVMRADQALTNTQSFNKELESAILCTVEETDLKKSGVAYNRIKDWVTSLTLLVHKKGVTPYQAPNTTHWIQCANDQEYCPVFSGDTRITIIRVESLDPLEMIAKKKLMVMLETEASDFLAAVLNLELPEVTERLNLPVIATTEKKNLENANMNLLEGFIKEKCFRIDGSIIAFSEFFDEFIKWLPPGEGMNWTKARVSKEFPSEFPKGKFDANLTGIGNLSFENKPSGRGKLTINGTGKITEIK